MRTLPCSDKFSASLQSIFSPKKHLLKILGLFGVSHVAYAGVIYGVEQIENQYRHVHYPAYVQMGSFSTMHAAQRLKDSLHMSIHAPTVIDSSHARYRVRVGPFNNQSSLKTFASKIVKGDHQQQFIKRPNAGLPRPRAVSTSLVRPVQTPVSQKPVMQRRYAVSTSPISVFPVQPGSHPELSVFLGGSYIPSTIKGQTLQLMPYEIGQYADTFTNQGSASPFTWGVGALYRFKLHAPSASNHIFDSLGAGMDVFQITNFSQTGNLLQFNLPEFENYTYTLKLNNIRVMANFDLDFHSVAHHFVPFVQAGIGGARTAFSYNSVPISPIDSPDLTLPNEASWNVAYQAGAGIKYVATTHLALSLRYLYANMGNVNSSTLGSTATLATPLTVNMSTQNVLFGLTYLR